MASSRFESVPAIVTYLQQLKPKKVLDLGIGFGKIGLLIREYLEAWFDKTTPDKWQIHIEGVEIYEPYHKNSFQHIIYNKIHYCNILHYQNYLKDDSHFDLITAVDILEHLTKDDAKLLINKLLKYTNNMLISVPIGSGWIRPPYGENKFEAHKAEWNTSELVGDGMLGFKILTEYNIPDGREMGVFVR